MGLKDVLKDVREEQTLDYPDEVDPSIADEIDELTENDEWQYMKNTDWRVVLVSVTWWALNNDRTNPADSRKAAQDKAAEVFDRYDQSTILNMCGAWLFEGDEYQPKQELVQRKWQERFEQLLEDIEIRRHHS